MLKANARVLLDALSDLAGERLAIDCKGAACCHGIVKGGGVPCEPSAASSAFNMPAALSDFVLFRLFEQTSSAHRPVLCTGVPFSGRISTRRTENPRSANCKAASLPARPAPMIEIRFIVSIVHSIPDARPAAPNAHQDNARTNQLAAYRQPLHQPGARIPLATVPFASSKSCSIPNGSACSAAVIGSAAARLASQAPLEPAEPA